MKFNRCIVLLIGALSAHLGLRADEGMWMPQQIPQLDSRLRSLGFTGKSGAFADLTGHPMGAVVSLGGCSASFVSPDGLIVTNHHCVTGGLQFNSSPGRNLLRDGFIARNRGEEIFTGPGSRVLVTTSVADVTEAITGNIDPGTGDRERYDRIERRIKERVATCEKDGLRCSVASFFEGLQYYEIAQLEIRDVRLVYAPAEGIGVFGGETDNWRWPRHTGDWSFLRAYVGKDGRPAPFSKDNIPYKPRHWLKVSREGARPGELVFVAGYPGRTQRHQIAAEVRETTEWSFPRSIRLAEEQLRLLEALSSNNPEITIKVANRIQGLNNGLTNRKGMLAGLVKGGILARREAQEKELEAWIAADPARLGKYGPVMASLRDLQSEAEGMRDRDAVLASLGAASSFLSAAQTIYRLSTQRPKSDLDREPGFQERDWTRIREAQERLQRTLDPTVDRALLGWALGLAAALPAGQRIEPLDPVIGLRPGMSSGDAERVIQAWLDRLYSGTNISDKEYRLGLLEKSTRDLEGSGDSFLGLARLLHPVLESIRETGKRRTGAHARLRPLYMQATLEKAGGLVAPDANGTLRVTYGRVMGVDARDGLFYKPQTTLAGIVEKHTGEGEFDAPRNQLEAIKRLREGAKTPYLDAALGDVPVNFLSNVDTTGGNSGSATLNGRGELIGLLFDGTYETVASDFMFDTVRTRSIHVDIRYMLWTMAEADGAAHLLAEMGLR